MVKSSVIWASLLLSSCGYAQDHLANWQEDIDVYAEKLVAGHIDPFHTLSKADFNKELRRIKNSLASKSENEILVELMRLTRRIGDGHTSFPLWAMTHDRFPLEVKLFDEDLRIVSTTDRHKGILGTKLISINGVLASDVFRRLSEVSPFSENMFSTAVRAAQYLPNATVLNGLGIVKNAEKAKFVFEAQGETHEINFSPSRSLRLDAHVSHLSDAVFAPIKTVTKDLWYGSSSDKKTVYVKFRRYTTVSKMDSFAQSLLGFINKNKSEHLIIDLRDNYGGDFFVGLKLAQRLVLADTINWKSGVYTLIDNVTFSAAMSNAAQFSQILNSKLVGSPTGARPSGYQDMGQFTLPNSKLEVTFSKRLYHFKEDHRDALYPDVHVEVSIEDHMKGYDRPLRWVLSDIGDTSGGWLTLLIE